MSKKDTNPTRQLLFNEARSGNWNLVLSLLNSGADVNWTDNNGQTILEYAVRKSNAEELCTTLIEMGADVNLLSRSRFLGLFRSAYHSGNIKIAEVFYNSPHRKNCRELLEENEDEDIDDLVYSGELEKIKIRVLFGDKLSWLGYGKDTLLHVAISEGHIDVAKYLVEQGLDVFQTNVDGESPLDTALKNGYWVFLNYITQKLGITYNQVDEKLRSNSKSYTPLLHSATAGKDIKIVQYLVEQCGFDVNLENFRGETPLFKVGQSGTPEIMQYLVEHGADVNHRSHRGETPLMFLIPYMSQYDTSFKGTDFHNAANATPSAYKPLPEEYIRLHEKMGPWVQMLEYLLQHGAEVNAQARHKQTALKLAVEFSLRDVMEILFKAGARADIPQPNAPLYWSIRNKRPDLTELLLKHGARTDERIPFMTAVNIMDMLERMSSIMEKKFNAPRYSRMVSTTTNPDGTVTVKETDLEKERQERDEHIKANKNRKPKEYHSPLHEAVLDHSTPAIQLLLDYGMDPNITSNMGQTPLHYVSVKKPHISFDIDLFGDKHKVPVATLLLKAGANINAQDKRGRTPLMAAIRNGCLSVFKFLIDNNADRTITDNRGRTAMDYAKKFGSEEIARILSEE